MRDSLRHFTVLPVVDSAHVTEIAALRGVLRLFVLKFSQEIAFF